MTAVTREPWMDDALCRQVGPELFFPPDGDNGREAKQVCAACEACSACLDYALRNDEKYGVFGGLGPKQRRVLHRERPRREPAQPPIVHGTPAGHRAHFRQKVPLCEPCRSADKVYRAELRELRRAS